MRTLTTHDQSTQKYFNEIALAHMGYFNDQNSFAYKQQTKLEEMAINMISNKSQKIIDVGCGRGNLTLYLADIFPEKKIVGIDFSDEMISIANENKKRFNVENVFYKLENIDAISFDANHFDTLICINVLHHVSKSNLSKVLKEFARITSSEIILEIKNSISPYYYFKKLRIKFETGLNIFGTSYNNLNQIFTNYGFSISKRNSWGNLGRYFSPNLLVKLRKN